MTTEFSTITPDGVVTHVRTLSRAAIMACQHLIMVSEHYRDDESCRCDDPNDPDMAEWGYVWGADSDGSERWGSPDE
jgi:hypothetical protein